MMLAQTLDLNLVDETKIDPKMDPIACADLYARGGLRKLLDEPGVEAFDLGDCAVRLGEGATAYVGRCFRLTGTPFGEVLACLGGWNLRRWGTQKGFLEVAWGHPNMEAWDPAPGLLVPWSRVLLIEKRTTTAWKARGF